MQLNSSLILHINETFTRFLNENVQVSSVTRVVGGDINQTFLLHTVKGKFFLKLNAAIFGHDFFEKEAQGLTILAKAGALKVPQPLFDGRCHQQIYLVMEYLEKGHPAPDFWSNFGTSMANLHRNTSRKFGFDNDNFIGKIPQRNHQFDNWSEFYAEQRIMPLVKRAFQLNILQESDVIMAEKLCSKLSSLLPEEIPALLHGDLWNGNFMSLNTGYTAIFDPAVYYGHREMDLSMTMLFGGFDASFYQAYHDSFTLMPGFEKRVEIYQLYPLLVHLLLFGGSYYMQVRNILQKFS